MSGRRGLVELLRLLGVVLGVVAVGLGAGIALGGGAEEEAPRVASAPAPTLPASATVPPRQARVEVTGSDLVLATDGSGGELLRLQVRVRNPSGPPLPLVPALVTAAGEIRVDAAMAGTIQGPVRARRTASGLLHFPLAAGAGDALVRAGHADVRIAGARLRVPVAPAAG